MPRALHALASDARTSASNENSSLHPARPDRHSHRSPWRTNAHRAGQLTLDTQPGPTTQAKGLTYTQHHRRESTR
jgi:hypothetical protein